MKDFDTIILGIAVGGSALALILHLSGVSPAQIEKKMQKEAISHGAAHYEVDTNGVVTFKWNK
jgi:flavin-dependent dehydrogenase